jgi:hypothetical protein
MEAKQSAGEEPQQPPQPQPPQPQPNTPILSTGAIVGLIVGGVAFLLLLAVLLVVEIYKTKRQNSKQYLHKEHDLSGLSKAEVAAIYKWNYWRRPKARQRQRSGRWTWYRPA